MEFTEENLQTIVDLQTQINELRALTYKNDFSNTYLQGKTVIQGTGAYQSSNFVTGSTGWQFNSDGDLEANSGTFRGAIAIGSGNNIFKADSNGIYLGHTTFGSAPFRVTMAGAVTASNMTISGGAITGMTVTAGTIRSSSGTDRIELTSGDILVFYDGGSPRLQINKNGILIKATSADWLIYPQVGSSTNLMIQVGDGTAGRFIFSSGGDFYAFHTNAELGTASKPWTSIHCGKWDGHILADSAGQDIGTDADRWDDIFATNFPASPIQVASSAIKVFKKITKIAHKDNKYTLETEDLPKEFKMKDKQGIEHTELKRSVGLCIQGIMELIDEVDKLKSK